MLDQATRLREMAAAYRAQAQPDGGRRTSVIAITSGKGGVGKTNLSINLAQTLVRSGKDVILFDGDIGLANADILMGTVPPYHLGHLLSGERDIFDLVHRTASGVRLIAGGSGLQELTELTEEGLQLFVSAIAKLEGQTDYLLLDTGAGISNTVLEFVLAADKIVMVTTPEPTALADAYAAMKALSRRQSGLQMTLVINQVEKPEEAEAAAERIMLTARDFLNLKVEHLGNVPRDPYVWQAVRHKTPFTVAYPGAPASRAVEAVARRLTGGGSPVISEPPRPGGFFDRLGSLLGLRRAGNDV